MVLVGAKNVLTKEEIENAECIIVAADKNVEMARFDGKKVIKTKVADGIHKAEELMNKLLVEMLQFIIMLVEPVKNLKMTDRKRKYRTSNI